jgi:hypothetical protein
MNHDEPTRRRFLRYLLTSPLVVGFGGLRMALAQNTSGVVGSAEEALDVMDFEAAAHKVLPPAHFGYLASGVDDDATVRANREGFSRFSLRVRRLVDVRNIDMSVSLFGSIRFAKRRASTCGAVSCRPSGRGRTRRRPSATVDLRTVERRSLG